MNIELKAKSDFLHDPYFLVRMDSIWEYVVLGENTFYSLKDKGASISDIFDYTKITMSRVEDRLF